jgi:hypothetical protein
LQKRKKKRKRQRNKHNGGGKEEQAIAANYTSIADATPQIVKLQ